MEEWTRRLITPARGSGEEAKEVCYAEGYKCVCVLGRRGESRALARRGLMGKQHGENEAQENYKTQRQIKDHLKRAVKTRTARESRCTNETER